MRKVKFLLAPALIVLAGCATTTKYEENLRSWVGRTEDDLVRAWGRPAQVRDTDGQRYLTYVLAAQRYAPGIAPSFQPTIAGTSVYTDPDSGVPGYSYSLSCKTTFELSNGVVRSWQLEGNACKAK